MAIVDEAYRFRLARPGPRWTMLAADDARRMQPGALAMASNGSIFAIVTAELAPGASLGELLSPELTATAVESEADLSVHGLPARRVVWTEPVDGVSPLRIAMVAFLRDDYAFRIIGWGDASDLAPDARELEPVLNGFSLLEGPVRGRDAAPLKVSARGPGWKLEDGEFVSATGRLRVRPRPGWRLALGPELAALDPWAEIALVSRNPTISIAVRAELVYSADPETFREAALMSTLARLAGSDPVVAARRLAVAGEPREFVEFRTESPRRYLQTVLYDRDLALDILIEHPSSLPEGESLRIDDGLAAIELLADADAAALTRELAAAPAVQNLVGPDYALRRGTFRDFTARWSWRLPAGFWQVAAGDAVAGDGPGVCMVAREKALGLSVAVAVAPAQPLQSHLDRVIAERADDAVHRLAGVTTRIDGVPAVVFTERGQYGAQVLERRVAVLAARSSALTIEVAGDAMQMQAYPEVVDAILAAFQLDIPATWKRFTGTEYRDLRMGFEFRLPDGRWQRSDTTQPAERAAGGSVLWHDSSRLYRVEAYFMPSPTIDDAFFTRHLEQQVARMMKSQTDARLVRERAEVDGLPAMRIYAAPAGRLEVLVVRRDQTIYLIRAAGVSAREASELPTRFRFVD